VSVAVAVAVSLTSYDTTAATRVPRLRIEWTRMDKRIWPDKEGAADKQCLGEGKL